MPKKLPNTKTAPATTAVKMSNIASSTVNNNNNSSSVTSIAKSKATKETAKAVESSPEPSDLKRSNGVPVRGTSEEKVVVVERGKHEREDRRDKKGGDSKGGNVKETRDGGNKNGGNKNNSSSINREKEKSSSGKDKGNATSSSTVNSTSSKTVSGKSNVMPLTGSVSSSSASSTSSSSSSGPVNHTVVDRKRTPQASYQQQSNNNNSVSVSINSADDHSSMTFISNSRSAKGNRKGDVAASSASTHRSPPSLSNSLKSISIVSSSPKKGPRREEGWKEVVRNENRSRSKKVIVPANAISRVIGRGGCNINTIREVSGAIIEVEKQKNAGDRNIVIRGTAESTRQAHMLINMMVNDPEKDLSELLPHKKNMASTRYLAAGHGYLSQSAMSSGTQAKGLSSATVLKTGNHPGVISGSAFPTQPPFSATVRQQNAVRPGMALSPAFPSNSAWPAFPAVSASSNSGGKKSAQSSVTSQAEAMAMFKSCAARQLFPAEKKGASAAASASTTASGTKITVSYTMAVSGNARTTKTVPGAGNATFAAKLTEPRPGTTTATAVAQPATAQQPKAGNNKGGGAALASGSAAARPSAALPNAGSAMPSSPRETHLPNGPIPSGNGGNGNSLGLQPGFSLASQSNCSIATTSFPSSSTGLRPASPNSRPTPPPVPQEYSPFNNLFSSVAQQSVWGKDKEESNGKGMNFASVAAANVKSSSSGICSSSPLNLSGKGVPPPPPPQPVADASKAPGYRGNAHVSPSSTTTSSMNSAMGGGGGIMSSNGGGCASVVRGPASSSRSRLPNSAPSTPPVGPIAPPSGSVVRKATPPLVLGSSEVIVSLSSSAPAGLMTNPLTSAIGLHHALSSPAPSTMTAAMQQQHSLLRPSLDLNPGFLQHSQTPAVQLVQQSLSGQAYVPTTSVNSSAAVPSIQSNLNPNAPDFSSRSAISSNNNNSGSSGGGGGSGIGGNPHQYVTSHSQVLQLGRLSAMSDNPVPFSHVAPVNPSSAVFSIQNMTSLAAAAASSSSSVTASSVGQSMTQMMNQNASMKHAFQPAPQQPQSLQQQQQHNSTLGSEFPQHLVRHVAISDALRLMGSMNPHHNLQGPLPAATVGSGGVAHLSQFPPTMANSLLQNQRSLGMARSKDDCSNLSPASSPHPNDQSSSLTMSMMADHGRVFGEDRKLPRPIGTERAHKKIPNYAAMGDCDIFQWRGSFGSSTETMPQALEDRLPVMQPANFVTRFGESLANVLDNSHHLEGNISVCRPTKSLMSAHHHGGLNSVFPPFVNGIPQPQMPVSQLYTTSAAAVGIDIWGNSNSMKPNMGDTGMQPPDNMTHPLNSGLVSGQMLGGGPGSGSGIRQQPSENKMLWNNWSHTHM